MGTDRGIPILLNTSFNNNVEPIVDSVYDALVCFLTTRLNYLVAGDYLIGKKDFHYTEYLKMIPSIPYHISIHQSRKYTSFHEMGNCFEIKNHYNQRDQSVISPGLFFILCDVNGKISLKDLMEMHEIKNEEKKKSIIDEILNLWGLRLLKLVPGETREGR